MSQRNDFFQAILSGDEAAARQIFGDGRLDPNIRDSMIDGTPALSLAVHSGMSDLVRDLLSQGANPNLSDGVKAPIHHAATREMVDLLAAAGADVNAQTLSLIDDPVLIRKGTTPLHLAVQENRQDVVSTLLKLNANPSLADSAQRIPEQYAEGTPETLRMLQASRGLAPAADAAAPPERTSTAPVTGEQGVSGVVSDPLRAQANRAPVVPNDREATLEANEIALSEGVAHVNSYRLDGVDRTTGWSPAHNDVNTPNADGMRPIEVAAQALNVREFIAIASHPEFDPTGTEPRKYAEMGRNLDAPDAEARYETIREALDMYDRAVSHLIRLDPAGPGIVPPESQLDNGLPTVTSAENPRVRPLDESRVAANDPDVVKAANDSDKSQAEPQMNPDLERVRLARDADRKAFESSQGQGDAARSDEQTHGVSREAEVSFVRRVLRGAMLEARERVESRFAPTLSRLDALSRKGVDKENEVKPAPILSKSGYDIPKSVVAQYVAFDGKFLDRKTEVVLFEDSGRKLSTGSEDRNVVRSMIEVAQAKNWGELQLKGSEEFRRQAWIAAELAGVKSKGFNPTEKDRALLQVAREEMRISGASKDPEKSPTQAPVEARNTMQPSIARERDPLPAVEPPAAETRGASAFERDDDTRRTSEPKLPEKSGVEPQAQSAPKAADSPAREEKAQPSQSDAAELAAAREKFNARAQAIKDRAKPGYDVLQEKAARMVLESRIKSLPKAAQERFMADFDAEVAKMKELGQELYVPVPKASKVLIEAAKLADQQRQSAHTQQQAQEQAEEMDR